MHRQVERRVRLFPQDLQPLLEVGERQNPFSSTLLDGVYLYIEGSTNCKQVKKSGVSSGLCVQ